MLTSRYTIKGLSILTILISACSGCTNRKSEGARPNIVLIMADDMGFSDIGCYGGEIRTPNIDGLAENGLRYTQFYNNARCCPTRASLMTGLYPHQAGMGWMTAAHLGSPQYQGELNDQCVTIAEVLGDAGYSTYMTGKWHLSRVRNIKAGVNTNWPKQRGFDRFFGIVDGGANYFTPVVFSDNERYPAPGEDFYLTHAISDSSVMFIDQHVKKSGSDPFFMYVAYTAPHWPLHALEKDIERYKDVYKAGWDTLRAERLARQKKLGIFNSSVALTDRDKKVPAWDDLPEEKQEEFAMRMAIYAAQVDAMDQGIGRIVDKLKELNQLDNTLIFFLSDNGACAEFISSGESKAINGKANTWESYRIHWANLGSTPYREYKHWIHEGGVATPFIVHWPEVIKAKNEFVREPGHVNDIMATCVAVAGAEYPAVYRGNNILPLEGESLVPHFKGDKNDRKPIYWEHEANIGVRNGKWKLVAKTAQDKIFHPQTLELYNMEEDPSELNNLAGRNLEKVKALFADWKEWAERVKVYPMDTREYGHRAREYQRQINGEFDELMAGWEFTGRDNVNFSIDTTGQISGANSAKIVALSNGEGSGILKWPFVVQKGEYFQISLKARSAGKAKVKVVFGSAGPNAESLSEEHLDLHEETQEVAFNTKPAQANGGHQLAIMVSGVNPGEPVWIDAVQLKVR